MSGSLVLAPTTDPNVFLTPHIVKNAADAAKLRDDTTKLLSPNVKKSVDNALGKGDNKGGKE